MEHNKVKIKFNEVTLENIYLPNTLKEFKEIIKKEFSLESNDILNFIITVKTDKENYELIDSESKYSKMKNEEIKEIIISEQNFNHKLSSKKVKSFEEKVEKVIEEELLNATRNIKTILLDNSIDEKKKNNFNKINRNVHNIKCSECKKEKIVGFYYTCNIEENINLCCNCAIKHEHPLFKIF